MLRRLVFAALVALPSVAVANAPDRSPRPMPRPADLMAAPVAAPAAAVSAETMAALPARAMQRPMPRPVDWAAQMAQAIDAGAAAMDGAEVARAALEALIVVKAQAAAADAPRPLPRPAGIAAQTVVAEGAVVAQAARTDTPRPRPRPAGLVAAVPETAPEAVAEAEALVVVTAQVAKADTPRPQRRPWGDVATDPMVDGGVSLASAVPMRRPVPRPDDLTSAPKGGILGGLFGRKKPAAPAASDGFVCGDPDIRGDELAPITSRVQGCGVEEPVRVTSVSGVRLNGAATLDCRTATALKSWINEGLQPAFGAKRVVELRIAGSYVCRPRNNQRGAKISEHGRGKAVDIAGFVFEDGSSLSVAQNYNRPMRKAQKAACGIFGTTLGPGSDGYHEDHIHLDTAQQENGPYCR